MFVYFHTTCCYLSLFYIETVHFFTTFLNTQNNMYIVHLINFETKYLLLITKVHIISFFNCQIQKRFHNRYIQYVYYDIYILYRSTENIAHGYTLFRQQLVCSTSTVVYFLSVFFNIFYFSCKVFSAFFAWFLKEFVFNTTEKQYIPQTVVYSKTMKHGTNI